MTLTSVEVRNSLGSILGTIPVSAPTTSQDYYIKKIDGLGPTDAVLAMSSFADYDGAVYHGSRLNNRNIVVTLGYSPTYSTNKNVGVLRKQAYSWFRPKSKLQLVFNDTDRERVYANVYVEKMIPDIFSKDPSIQISMLSEEAYFGSMNLTSITASADLNVNLSTYGDSPTGFNFTATIGSSPTTVIRFINKIDPDIWIYYAFAAGDVVKISTIPGSKYANVTRGGVTTSLLNSLSNSTLQMLIDNNTFNFRVNTSNSSTSFNYQLEFRPKWSGV